VAPATRSIDPATASIELASPSNATRVCSTVWEADSASLRTSSATTAKPFEGQSGLQIRGLIHC
jgi:hypothetical protein